MGRHRPAATGTRRSPGGPSPTDSLQTINNSKEKIETTKRLPQQQRTDVARQKQLELSDTQRSVYNFQYSLSLVLLYHMRLICRRYLFFTTVCAFHAACLYWNSLCNSSAALRTLDPEETNLKPNPNTGALVHCLSVLEAKLRKCFCDFLPFLRAQLRQCFCPLINHAVTH